MPAKRAPASSSKPRKLSTPGAGNPDWQEATIDHMRALIREADPEAVEEVKWRKPSNPDGVPVWSHDGIVCTGESHKNHVRFTFARGAALEDPDQVFNSGFNGNVLRAIVLKEGDAVNARAFKSLFRAAAALNAESRGR
jgi:hypothetical protein